MPKRRGSSSMSPTGPGFGASNAPHNSSLISSCENDKIPGTFVPGSAGRHQYPSYLRSSCTTLPAGSTDLAGLVATRSLPASKCARSIRGRRLMLKPRSCAVFADGACRARTGDPQLAKPSGGDSGEGGSDPERPRLAGDSDEDDPALAGADPDGSDRAVGQAFGWYRAPYVDDDPRSQRGPSCGTRRRPGDAGDAPSG